MFGEEPGSGSNAIRVRAGSSTIVNAILHNSLIIPEVSYQSIWDMVSSGHIVILKGVFEPRMMKTFRRAISEWATNNEPFPHGKSPSTAPKLNYHRIDDGSVPSVCPHLFHQFGFNDPETLPGYLAKPAGLIAESLRTLQNSIASTDFEISLTGLRLKVLHYPSGGGYLQEHAHPLEPQRIGLIGSMSEIGSDVASGGTYFQTPFGRINTEADHDIGDIIVFRYDLPHGVAAVDRGKVLNWNLEAGKWSLVLELRDTHALSHRTPV